MLIDISQELFSCRVYPGDPRPVPERTCSMARGDLYNLTSLSLCAHNGTHVDAPFHFLREGKTVDQMGLEPFVGECYVARHTGEVTEADARAILDRAEAAGASFTASVPRPTLFIWAANMPLLHSEGSLTATTRL